MIAGTGEREQEIGDGDDNAASYFAVVCVLRDL